MPFAARTGADFADTIRETNSQAGPLCRSLLHNGPGFSPCEQKRAVLSATMAATGAKRTFSES